MSNIQCVDLKADRELGEYWEKQFCLIGSQYDKCFTPHQWHRQKAAVAYLKKQGWNIYTLPDITIWSAPGEHHEIKHKNTNKYESYGLETYRFKVLCDFAEITQQPVYYTIHDHDLAGGKYIKENNIEHWCTAKVGRDIKYDNGKQFWGFSWVNGEKKRVLIYYWHSFYFIPLTQIWDDIRFVGGELGATD